MVLLRFCFSRHQTRPLLAISKMFASFLPKPHPSKSFLTFLFLGFSSPSNMHHCFRDLLEQPFSENLVALFFMFQYFFMFLLFIYLSLLFFLFLSSYLPLCFKSLPKHHHFEPTSLSSLCCFVVVWSCWILVFAFTSTLVWSNLRAATEFPNGVFNSSLFSYVSEVNVLRGCQYWPLWSVSLKAL